MVRVDSTLWEYKITRVCFPDDGSSLERDMNVLGGDRWDFQQAVTLEQGDIVLFFKRIRYRKD